MEQNQVAYQIGKNSNPKTTASVVVGMQYNNNL